MKSFSRIVVCYSRGIDFGDTQKTYHSLLLLNFYAHHLKCLSAMEDARLVERIKLAVGLTSNQSSNPPLKSLILPA